MLKRFSQFFFVEKGPWGCFNLMAKYPFWGVIAVLLTRCLKKFEWRSTFLLSLFPPPLFTYNIFFQFNKWRNLYIVYFSLDPVDIVKYRKLCLSGWIGPPRYNDVGLKMLVFMFIISKRCVVNNFINALKITHKKRKAS